MKSSLAVCLLLIVSQALGKELPQHQGKDDLAPVQQELDPNYLPLNVAQVRGTTARLRCGVINAAQPHSVQWTEYAYNANGSLISDNGIILDHPQRSRYRIISDVPGRYDLEITNIGLADGGVYVCEDAQTALPNKKTHGCSLTVMDPLANCTSTILPSGIVLDGSYQVQECWLYYKGAIRPNMTWIGPSPFQQAYTSTAAEIWNGMQFNVTRDMDTRSHNSQTYFTGYFLPQGANFASNIPNYVNVRPGRQLFVRWGPTSMEATPIRAQYEPGEVLLCTADALPLATFTWQNMRTNQIFEGNAVVIQEGWRGFNQSMRCEARNTIEGTIYSNQLFIPVLVPAITTPPTSASTTPTTPILAESPCRDLTGPWRATSPAPANLCIKLDLNNRGQMTGLVKNGTDTYWVDVVGRAKSDSYDQVGFNGIWPSTLGVSSFVGECHRCFNEEQLLINVITKTKNPDCGNAGTVRYSTQYLFTRSPGLMCPNLPPAL